MATKRVNLVEFADFASIPANLRQVAALDYSGGTPLADMQVVGATWGSMGTPWAGRHVRLGAVRYSPGDATPPGIKQIAAVVPDPIDDAVRHNYQLLEGLMAYYKLAEAAGDARLDSSGYGNTLAVTGAVGQAVGRVGDGASFGGTGNYLEGSHITLGGDVDFTVDGWFYLDNTTANHMLLSQFWGAGGQFELFYYVATQRFHLDVGDGGGGVVGTVIGNTFGAPDAATWYYIQVYHDAVNNKVGISVNGGAFDLADTTGPAGESNTTFLIGYGNSTAFAFTGRADEVGLWNRRLSATETAQRYGGGAGNTYPFAYSIVREDPTIGGQAAMFLKPSTYNGTFVIYHHGLGEVSTALLVDNLKAAVVSKLLGAGCLLAGSTAHGNWGNDDSLADYLALYNFAVANYGVSKVVHMSQSAGGISGLLTLAAGNIPAAGWLGIYPACGLRWCYDAELSGIATAYGIAGDGSDYDAKTAGHDPVLLNASAFAGMRTRFYASPDDTTVTELNNTDAMAALIAGGVIEGDVVVCSGAHGDPSHFQPDDVLAFVQRC